MRYVTSVVFLLVCPAFAFADVIAGSRFAYGNWSGAGYTVDDGTFSHCAISAAYNHGNTLLFSVNGDASVSVGVSVPSDTFAPNEKFPVALFVDRRTPFFGTANAINSGFAVLTIADFERALESFRRGRTLVVQSQFGDIPFDLTGTSRALAMAFDCAVKYFDVLPLVPVGVPDQIDPAILMQVATSNISALGVSDFVFLTEQEMGEVFPNASSATQKLFWRSQSLNLLSGVVVANKGDTSDLRSGDANDLSSLATLCDGDFVTGARQLPDAKVAMREIRAACTHEGTNSEHYLTKFFVGQKIVYSWLWFSDQQLASEAEPTRRQMSENAALQTASYFTE